MKENIKTVFVLCDIVTGGISKRETPERQKDNWEPQGIFLTEQEALDNIEHDNQCLMECPVGKLLVKQIADHATKLYWPRLEKWEDSIQYKRLNP